MLVHILLMKMAKFLYTFMLTYTYMHVYIYYCFLNLNFFLPQTTGVFLTFSDALSYKFILSYSKQNLGEKR